MVLACGFISNAAILFGPLSMISPTGGAGIIFSAILPPCIPGLDDPPLNLVEWASYLLAKAKELDDNRYSLCRRTDIFITENRLP